MANLNTRLARYGVLQGSAETAVELGNPQAKRHRAVVKGLSPRSSNIHELYLSHFIKIQLLACIWTYKTLWGFWALLQI